MTRQPHVRRGRYLPPEQPEPESPASLALGLVAILVIALALVVLLPATAWAPVVPG